MVNNDSQMINNKSWVDKLVNKSWLILGTDGHKTCKCMSKGNSNENMGGLTKKNGNSTINIPIISHYHNAN
jgi:hypothetical protein